MAKFENIKHKNPKNKQFVNKAYTTGLEVENFFCKIKPRATIIVLIKINK